MADTNTNVKNTFQNKKFKKPYKAKNKGKGAVKAAVVRKQNEPVFAYNCECHGSRATKVPCVSSEKKDSTLGSWRCSITNRPTKVTRTKAKEEVEVAA